MDTIIGRVPEGTGLSSSTEPSCTVSALSGFDPSRKNDVFQIQMDAQQRINAFTSAQVAAKALQWFNEYGRQVLSGSTVGVDGFGAKEAKPYLLEAQQFFARRIQEYAVKAVLADMEKAYASAIEARSDATPKSGAAEGESATAESGDAQSTLRGK